MSSAGHDAILGAAVELFATRGYAATSMREVAQLAGVAPPTIYHHFRSKEKLYAEIVRGGVVRFRALQDDAIRGAPSDPAHQLAAFVETALSFTRGHTLLGQVVFALQAGAGPQAVADRFRADIEPVREHLRALYAEWPGIDTVAAEAALTAQLYGLVQLSFSDPGVLDTPGLGAHIVRLHVPTAR